MADEEFSRTVLCEAVDYLKKLASNLGSRTVSLKEKRINKSKLKDTHSLRSAAEKVLLLCQLSKKSIENVEKSVKDMVHYGKGDGGRNAENNENVPRTSATRKGVGSSSNYSKLKISGKKYVLRIPQKVNVKHFMSVKVFAKSIPKSMLEKYPIYQDCKLYHERRRSEKKTAYRVERERSSEAVKTEDEHIKTSTRASDDDEKSVKHSIVQKEKEQSNSNLAESKFPKSEDKHKSLKSRRKSSDENSENSDYERRSKKSKSPINHRKSVFVESDNDNNNEDSNERKNRQLHCSSDEDQGIPKQKSFKKLRTSKGHDTDSDGQNESDKEGKTRKASCGDTDITEKLNTHIEQETAKTKDVSEEVKSKESVSTGDEDIIKSRSPTEQETSMAVDDSDGHVGGDSDEDKTKKSLESGKEDIIEKPKSLIDQDTSKSVDDSDGNIEGYSEKDKSKRSLNSDEGIIERQKSPVEQKTSKAINDSGSDVGGDSEEDKTKKSINSGEEDIIAKPKSFTKRRDSSVVDNSENDVKESDEEAKTTNKSHSRSNEELLADTAYKVSIEEHKTHEKHPESSIIELDSEDEPIQQKKRKPLPKRTKKINSDSSDSETISRKSNKKVLKHDSENSESSEEKESTKNIYKYRKQTETSIIDLDSDNGEPNCRNSQSNSDELHTNKKIMSNHSDSDGEEKENVSSDHNQNEKSETTKPLIKLVNINKLLKPEIANKDEPKRNPSSKLIVHLNRKGEIKEKYISDKKEKGYHNNEDEFWAKKRLEVKQFIPKKVVINVHRLKLPLSVDYLVQENLKRIWQNGNTVCEVPDKSNNKTIQVSEPREEESHLAETENTLVSAKNALLNDSDNPEEKDSPLSDTIQHENEIVKKSLLNDSGSDQNEDNHKSDKIAIADSANANSEQFAPKESTESITTENNIEKEPQSFTKDSASPGKELPVTHNSKKEEKELETNYKKDREEAKSALLNDSSESNSSKSSTKQKSRLCDKKSRRKHIMESMHAKKMLLNYSSSSDTEDEQLKSVFKDIKGTLLKDIPSVEDKTDKSGTKNSSESEEEIVGSVRKKRKISEITQSDSNDANGNQTGKNTSSEKHKSTRKKMGRSREIPDDSSHSSGSKDDKIIKGLTNLKSLEKPCRDRGSGSEKAGDSPERKMSKTHIQGEPGLLEAPSSSDNEVTGGESDVAEEDLPPVTLSGLNGSDTLGHLAKDDLLVESESDSSKDKNTDNVKKESDSDAENVKAKRRKANAIASSDSEAGSSRRKEKAMPKISDFEDSEEESSEPTKKNKRKKKNSDSDASEGSSSEGGKKKRRRIKQIESDASGSDTENEGKSKHGRKNIRKVMGKNQLEEATKKAARRERERLARIVERQKMYNNLEFDESGKPDEVILDKVVLDFDPETKEPLIEVDRGLVKKLKPHQANGIKFMWDACFESVKRIKKDKGSGCILAHCMGLGKTLQVVSLTHTLLTHSELTRVNRVLVVCPLSTVLNWVNEFKMWLKHAERDYEVDIYELSRHKQNTERAFQLSQWFLHGGVCVLGYEMFRNLSADNVKKYKKKMLRQLQEALVDPGPDLVVCDEGHLLKNEKTSLSQSMNRVKTLRRIVLTGTPLQNNLKEYYCMVQFVKPNLLGKYNEYLNRFVNPITNGQYTDSTEHDIRIMKRRSHVLHKMLDGAVQRRDYGVLAPFLPPKHEYVLFITLSEVQIKLYQHYLDNYSRRPLPGKSSGFLFPDFQSLQRIWTHPLVLKYNSERYEIMQQKKREREEDSEGSLADFIDDESTAEESSTDEESDSLSDLSDDSRKKSKKKKSSKKNKKDKDSKGGPRRGTRANPVEALEDDPDPDVLEVKNDNPTEWWIPLVTEDEIEDMRNSHKLVLLFEILRQCEAIGDKLLVFSQSLYSLDLIEHFLGKVDEATQEGRIDEKLGNHVGSWTPGVDYFRLDGSTSCENRSIWCKNFNREDNPRARLFLISTRAGGLGINLVAANRVVIFDVSWNPSHDVQSIFRVYRFGQKKPCYVYRFLAMGTMEEKIYERQVTKQAISKRVIDEQQIDRHYAENDLAELYKFEPRPPAPRPVPLVPKDRLFAEMLKDHETAIYKFHEHDSLLENKEEETLSEEERKAAWDDFENEKNRPPPSPFPNWPMHNGMVMNPLAQQQQQLAYAAVAAMLRKDMPNLPDDNIRAMLPLIYAANPAMFGGYDYGLMQKVQEMTNKYAQPGMMNPAMNMNLMMNAGSGVGAGGMSASGLQPYEPPWQRQQQQQMRLQQLMQQQNQMGAKLYAGGLGSRDPVAMALQQQRAREIMLGGGGGAGAGAGAGAGRPRGRPPGPRPAPAPSDVVNLDSD